MTKIENPYCNMHMGGGISAGFVLGGLRYHVWLNNDLTVQGGVLYCNPPKPLGSARHFRTRKLDAAAAKNAPLIAQLLAAVDVNAARVAFRQKEIDRLNGKSREHDAALQRELFAEHGAEMLAALQKIDLICGTGTDGRDTCLDIIKAAARAAIAKVTPPAEYKPNDGVVS